MLSSRLGSQIWITADEELATIDEELRTTDEELVALLEEDDTIEDELETGGCAGSCAFRQRTLSSHSVPEVPSLS